MADDLAQDCFMHAWNKLSTYSGRGSFIGWLLKVAYTTFLQSKRKSKRYAEILESAGHVADQESRSTVLPADEVTGTSRCCQFVSQLAGLITPPPGEFSAPRTDGRSGS